jgi:hypothetical protein
MVAISMETNTGSALEKRLSALLARLAPTTAVKLASGLERQRLQGVDGLPYDLILSSLRPVLERNKGPRPGLPDPLRQFCAPFEDLLVNRRDPSKHLHQIARASIDPVWIWLSTELLPDALHDITARIVEHTLGNDQIALSGSIAVLHASCSAALLSAIETSRGDIAQRRKLERQLGGDAVLEDARLMAEALAVAPFMLRLGAELPKHIGDFDDHLVAFVGELYEDAREALPEYAVYVPLATMTRLSAPWQILRLARKVSGFGNDAAVSRSGLAELGEIFLGEVEDIARGLESLRPGKADLAQMARDITRFAEISQGFIGEIDIRRVSDWGHRILAARAKLSAAIAEEMSRFQQDLAKALPIHQVGTYGKNGPRRPDVSHEPENDRVAKVMGEMEFLSTIGAVADSIGVHAHCRSIQQQIETYLVAYEDGLIEEIRRTSDAERDHALSFLEVVIDCRETMGETKTADILRRRGHVAAQAA